MKLLIAIPALNEEESIESIIQRSLDARDYICSHSPVNEVEITVVSDGSTDRTVELASRYTDRIGLIVFPQNKGYGAAIKEAWRRSDADLVSFLDADGTCEPKFFADLCERLVNDDADVILGCRINQQSEMPKLRRFGNLLFATILTAFATERVRDTASGMRVVRRSALGKIYPLPDGLHFTPAMSARSMMSNQIGGLRTNTETTPSWGFGFGGAVLMDPELAAVPQAAGTWKWGGVYGHHWFVDPVNRLSVGALSNTTVEGMAGGFVAELRDAIYATG